MVLYQKNKTSEHFLGLKRFGSLWNETWKPVGSHLFLSQNKNYCRFLVSGGLCVPNWSCKTVLWTLCMYWMWFHSAFELEYQPDYISPMLTRFGNSLFSTFSLYRCKYISQRSTEIKKKSWNYSIPMPMLQVDNEKLKWTKWL